MTIKQLVELNHHKYNTCSELAESLKLNPNTVHTYLSRLGIKLEGSGMKSKYPYNVFDDSKVSKYWLGYISADGNVSAKHNSISIVSKDVEHIERLREFVPDVSRSIHSRERATEQVYFSSKETKEYLISVGITPAKSKTLEVTQTIIDWDFLRGVFDGDGSVRLRDGSCEMHITSASRPFLLQLGTFLDEQGVNYTIRQKTKDITPCYGLYVSALSVPTVFEQMYADTDLYLERKFTKLRTYVETRLHKYRMNSEKVLRDNPEPSLT